MQHNNQTQSKLNTSKNILKQSKSMILTNIHPNINAQNSIKLSSHYNKSSKIMAQTM